MVTIVDGSTVTEVEGEATATTVLLSPHALEATTGWDLRPEGFCRGEVCVPRRPSDGVLVDDQIDLAAFAALLQRPIAYEASAGVAVLADSSEDHAATIAEGTAPPFTLPDLDGNPVGLADFRGQEEAARRLVVVVRVPLGPAGLAGAVRGACSARGSR